MTQWLCSHLLVKRAPFIVRLSLLTQWCDFADIYFKSNWMKMFESIFVEMHSWAVIWWKVCLYSNSALAPQKTKSHYLNQWWPSSLPLYVIRLRCVYLILTMNTRMISLRNMPLSFNDIRRIQISLSVSGKILIGFLSYLNCRWRAELFLSDGYICNTLRQRFNCHHFADAIFKFIFVNVNLLYVASNFTAICSQGFN